MAIETLDELKAEGILDYLSDIPERRQLAFKLRYGLSGNPPMTYEEIGHEFDFSRTQARNYTLDAIKKMRKAKIKAEQIAKEQERQQKLNLKKEECMVSDLNLLKSAIMVLEQYPDISSTAELKELLSEKIEKKEYLKERILNMPVDILGASVRTLNCLASQRPRIETIGQLAMSSSASLRRTRNFGLKSHEEVVSILKKCGLGLGMTQQDACDNLLVTSTLFFDIRDNFKERTKYLTYSEEQNAQIGLEAMAELLKPEETTNE